MSRYLTHSPKISHIGDVDRDRLDHLAPIVLTSYLLVNFKELLRDWCIIFTSMPAISILLDNMYCILYFYVR